MAPLAFISAWTAALLLAPRTPTAGGLAAPAAACRAAPMRVPTVRMEMVLTEENVMAVLEEADRELGTMFGSDPQSAKVGITGRVEFVELDGPIVVIRLSGRFWHARSRVLERLETYILQRIPEAVGVEVEDLDQLNDALDPETGLPVNEKPGLGPPPPLQ